MDTSTPHILVIDDEEGMRMALSEALSRAGYEPTCCADGRDAISQARRRQFAMIISDIKLQGMQGIEVLREMKKIAPSTPVVLITAYGSVTSAVAAMKEGAYDYLIKPFSFENIVETVRAGMMQAGRLFSRSQSAPGHDHPRDIVTCDPAMRNVLKIADAVAASDSTVLICGESGTGKELLARYLHGHSTRSESLFVAVNCAAIPDNLLESELFGHEKGAFTGAASRKLGKFEIANGGTLLLDEIGEMSMMLQSKLLRVLQEFEIDRVGGRTPVKIDVRVIATTNVDLLKAVREGRFREDLYYRLNVVPLTIPPLRQRPRDIDRLVEYFVERFARADGDRTLSIDPEARQAIRQHGWPGNVRELQNSIQRAVLLCRDNTITTDVLMLPGAAAPTVADVPVEDLPAMTIQEMERRLITKTLQDTGGNRTHAAAALGISIRTLRNKLKEYREQNFAVDCA